MNTLQNFTKQLFDCVRTFTIYDPFIAARYADFIEDLTGVRPVDRDNPYFYHLQGMMFNDPSLPELNDEPITVPSMDKESDPIDPVHGALYHAINEDGTYSKNIILTKDALDAHPVTKDRYLNNPEYLTMLMDRHVLSSGYIKNCFYPVMIDFDTQGNVNFEMFELLNYQRGILEHYEEDTLIDETKVFLEQIRKRWTVPNYLRLELYAHDVFNSIIYLLIPIVMLKKRIDNLHTANIHNELLWEYLMGCGLGDYRDILTRDQQLFLYKNIKYLLFNRGTSSTLKILADKLLSPYSITLNEKRLLSSTTNGSVTTVHTPIVVRKNVLDKNSMDNMLPFELYNDVYDAEVQAGLEPDYGPELLKEQKQKLKYTSISSVPTKLLEFNAELNYDISVMEFIRYAIETTLYLALEDKFQYTPTILFSGTEPIVLSVKECMALLMYALWMTEAPVFTLDEKTKDSLLGKRVLIKSKRVTLTEDNIDSYNDAVVTLVGPVIVPRKFGFMRPYKLDPDLSTTTFIKEGKVFDYRELLGDDILDNRDIPTPIHNKDDYLELLNTTFARRIHDQHIATKESTATVQHAMDMLYHKLLYRQVRSDITLVDDTNLNTIDINGTSYVTYEDWFASDTGLTTLMHHMDNSSEMHEDYKTLAALIVKEIADVLSSQFGNYATLTNTQFNAMRKLFIQLCSYDVVFLDTYSELMDPMYIPPIISEDIDTIHVTEQVGLSTLTKLIAQVPEEKDDPNPVIQNNVANVKRDVAAADTTHDYDPLESADTTTPDSNSVAVIVGTTGEASTSVISLTLSSVKKEQGQPIIGKGHSDMLTIDCAIAKSDLKQLLQTYSERLSVHIGFPEKYIDLSAVFKASEVDNDPPTALRSTPEEFNTRNEVKSEIFVKVGVNRNNVKNGTAAIFDKILI